MSLLLQSDKRRQQAVTRLQQTDTIEGRRASMAKRKRSGAPANAVKKAATATGIPSPPHDSHPTNTYSVISPEEIDVTVETLRTLAEHPALIKSKACKELRTAVYDFRQACTTGLNTAEGSNLTARISAALSDAKLTDALILLAEMRIRREAPSLGALCRWVRTLDVVSGLSIHVQVPTHTVVGHNAHNDDLIRVLDAILRVTGPTDTTAHGIHVASGIALQQTWDLRDGSGPTREIGRSVDDKTIFASCPADIKDRFTVLDTTPGPLRKPPNLHPAVLFASQDDAIVLGDAPKTQCYTHPIVPDLRLIKDVLSPDECTSIIAAGEAIDFIPDAPLRPQGEDTSVLAHNFYWIVDDAFHNKLWERVKAFVPDNIAGKEVRGINRRFRVYRYVPGAEYRCHIDGAWPPSGIAPTIPPTYVYDASPASARQSSLFTFLIYLNDDFRGGETTFFIPSAKHGVINAYPIRPVMGSVAVFPHGEARGALLHEGTGVVEGAKYVIRTDVEYNVG
ncbi:prolyl 4-hydroxylase [Dothidotthia symphoricarpi CBS 119687]|uniref:Prolyl 4-hydroxylase n=1 Tax=Dothidotthia symphoricarpi CBS 119687 TaxID=1392245 RepID=A0A6A6A4W4_9PLEO|nr:prolyl 4-hydroxylase [Dothidotthia symphoricarpi CBS 119687]KAF2127032.1 prolyl 4-hydroxylase [Dothidotthia symphoricarpi CBS 119687]